MSKYFMWWIYKGNNTFINYNKIIKAKANTKKDIEKIARILFRQNLN